MSYVQPLVHLSFPPRRRVLTPENLGRSTNCAVTHELGCHVCAFRKAVISIVRLPHGCTIARVLLSFSCSPTFGLHRRLMAIPTYFLVAMWVQLNHPTHLE